MYRRLLFALALFTSAPQAIAEGGADFDWRQEDCKGDADGCERKSYQLAGQGKENPSFILLIRACREGHGASCARVAWLLYDLGAKFEAEVILNHSCNRGHGPSCHHLAAFRRYRGEHVKAAIAQRRACKLGLGDACLKDEGSAVAH